MAIPHTSASVWALIRKGDPWDCWEWQGYVRPNGYGEFSMNDKNQRAHRFAWSDFTGQALAPGQSICHHCDNPLCCNPCHLYVGDNRTNTRDRYERGRSASGDENGTRTRPDRLARGKRNGAYTRPEKRTRLFGKDNGTNRKPESRAWGEKHGNALLTLAQVEEIRALYAAGGESYRTLGLRYGVARHTIGAVVRGETYTPPSKGRR
jgi:hypothetical protein